MSQSLAKIYIHLIFSTKNREQCIPYNIGVELHGYLGGILNGLGCSPIEINTEPDHAHLLFVMARTESISDVVGQIKKSSNDWLRNRDQQFRSFYWQGGYGAFSVSQSAVEEVRQYIRKPTRNITKRFHFKMNTRLSSNDTKLNLMNNMYWD